MLFLIACKCYDHVCKYNYNKKGHFILCSNILTNNSYTVHFLPCTIVATHNFTQYTLQRTTSRLRYGYAIQWLKLAATTLAAIAIAATYYPGMHARWPHYIFTTIARLLQCTLVAMYSCCNAPYIRCIFAALHAYCTARLLQCTIPAMHVCHTAHLFRYTLAALHASCKARWLQCTRVC